MHCNSDQNPVRLGSQRLLMQVLGSKLGDSRSQSPSHADSDTAVHSYTDAGVSLLAGAGPGGSQQFGAVLAADGKHTPDRTQWGAINSGSSLGGSPGLQADAIRPWAQAAGGHLLGQQGQYDDTGLDTPMANLQLQQHLQSLQAGSNEAVVGSWPGAPHKHSNTVDAALPFFQGRPIRTSSNLSNISQGVQRTASFNGPASARAAMGSLGHEGSFVADQLCFGSCNSAPITPRSPSFGFNEEEPGMPMAGMATNNSGSNGGGGGGGLRGYEARHGPSKLRVSSSDVGGNNHGHTQGLHIPASAALAAANALQGSMDAFAAASCPLGVSPGCGTPDHLAASNLAMALQQQHHQAAAALHGMPVLPVQPGGGPQASAAAMAQAAALMAGLQDPSAAAANPAAFGLLNPNLMPDGGAGNASQMQMLLYFAQLGMFASMNGSSPMAMPGVPPGPLPAVPGMMGYHMMSPQQVMMAQQQWQAAGMAPTTIANIAAAAAVAATAATSQDGEPGSAGRTSSRPRGAAMDKPGRLRCDKGGRGSSGRLDDVGGSPTVGGRLDLLLEEYKNNRTRRWEMRDILGHMLEFSLDQLGSRFIQQKLDSLTPEELEAAFAEVSPKGLMLMNDVFGNYVIQKFLDMDVEAHRQELAAQMKGQVLSLSLQLYSCRVIQKALEVLPLETKISMVGELDGALMRCVRDQNGNHVIQKVIECVPTEHITGLLDTFSGNLVSLSQHPFGCRVMQRILEHCTDQGRYNAFMAEILKATVQLAQDQYGNYVIQHVVEQGAPAERDAVYSRLFPHIVVLSQNKFASNVVEKMLLHCSVAQRGAIVEEFLRQGTRPSGGDGSGPPEGAGGVGAGGEQSALEQMMQDQYGNYVVQKTLEVCDEGQRERLLSRVRCYYEILKTSTFGKHIVNRLEKLLSAGLRIQVNALSPTVLPHPAAAAGKPGLMGMAGQLPQHQEQQQQQQQPLPQAQQQQHAQQQQQLQALQQMGDASCAAAGQAGGMF